MNSIIYQNFVENISPLTAYLLGYLWADGSLNSYKGNKVITISVIENDGKFLKELFLKTGEWKIYRHLMRTLPNNQPQLQIYKHERDFFEWLTKHGYETKSGGSMKNIINAIPIKFHNHFWRGYIDGDGYFTYKKKTGYNPTFGADSTFDQDWGCLENLCKSLNVHYYILRRQRKLGRNSELKVERRNDVIKIGEYLYQNSEGLRLERKKIKFEEIKAFKNKLHKS